MKFGFFDSGLGGLLMMQSCILQHPHNNYVYVGDTKNLPYGPRASVEIDYLMEPYLLYLIEEEKCDYVFIACNTASVRALPIFIKKYPHYKHHIIDIIIPTLEFLNNISPAEILVLATQGTVASKVYTQIKDTIVRQVAMPGLVDLIEQGRKVEAIIMVRDALSYYPSITSVLLGCTHYVWLKDDLKTCFPSISFISQDTLLKKVINKLSLRTKKQRDFIFHKPRYYVSGSSIEYSKKYNFPFKKLPL